MPTRENLEFDTKFPLIVKRKTHAPYPDATQTLKVNGGEWALSKEPWTLNVIHDGKKMMIRWEEIIDLSQPV